MRELTEQERFWQGEFGDQYVDRNDGEVHVANVTAFFAQALRRAGRIDSVLELGTNRGLNLRALNRLFPRRRCWASSSTPRPATSPRPWASPTSGRARCSTTRCNSPWTWPSPGRTHPSAAGAAAPGLCQTPSGQPPSRADRRVLQPLAGGDQLPGPCGQAVQAGLRRRDARPVSRPAAGRLRLRLSARRQFPDRRHQLVPSGKRP